jgi:ABC-type Fe3+/spermidine/putrescine transport system ATPase subunit
VSSETNGPLLEIRSVAKRFGAVTVLSGISLAVAPGEFLTVLGASGSGKTTLLRLIAGFEEPDAGEIWMAGQCLDGLPPYRRRVNTVFQSYALFPHLSVFENVAHGLAMVKMSDFAARAPRQLSGGQQQRVALARALVNRPQLLLLDEPLSALDANLRREMQSELKALQREVGISFVFVTHDQEEAMALSDRIALLRAGELEQVAPPREIYRRPVSVYAAQFIGQTNLLRGQIADGVARCGALAWPIVDGARASELAVFSLRPESIRLADSSVAPQASGTLPSADAANGSGRARFRATVRRQTFGGALDLLELECAGGSSLLARLPTPGPLEGEQCFEFSGEDAVRVRDDGSRSPEPGAPPQGRS